jgi:enoyl-CoA hydratase/carnithine racemase
VGKIALVTMDNGMDYKKPNTFDAAAMQSLGEALQGIVKEPDVKGMLLTGKHYIFAAGADLTQVPFITTFEQGYGIGKIGHDTMKQIMALPFPTLAAINGAALGGGLEIALYCRYAPCPGVCRPSLFLNAWADPGWRLHLGTRLLGVEILS